MVAAIFYARFSSPPRRGVGYHAYVRTRKHAARCTPRGMLATQSELQDISIKKIAKPGAGEVGLGASYWLCVR
jgi:hypothetical protein